MPSVSSLLASRRVGYAISLCCCPLDPLFGLLSAHDASPDQWSSLVLCDLRAIAVSEFGQGASLGDSFDDWLALVSDMILRPSKWKTMLARARTEDWWDDPNDDLGEDALECGNIDRMGALVVFTVEQSTCPECRQCFQKWSKASRSKLLDHAQYRSKGCRVKILSSQPVEACFASQLFIFVVRTTGSCLTVLTTCVVYGCLSLHHHHHEDHLLCSKSSPRRSNSERIMEQTVDVPVPHVMEGIEIKYAPVIEYVALTLAVSSAAPAPVNERVASAPAVAYRAPATVIEYVAKSAVTCAAPAPVIESVASSRRLPTLDFRHS